MSKKRKKEEETLKPCPFCGGEAVSRYKPHWVEDDEGDSCLEALYYVQCSACEARSKIEYAKQFAINAWNRRTPDD